MQDVQHARLFPIGATGNKVTNWNILKKKHNIYLNLIITKKKHNMYMTKIITAWFIRQWCKYVPVTVYMINILLQNLPYILVDKSCVATKHQECLKDCWWISKVKSRISILINSIHICSKTQKSYCTCQAIMLHLENKIHQILKTFVFLSSTPIFTTKNLVYQNWKGRFAKFWGSNSRIHKSKGCRGIV